MPELEERIAVLETNQQFMRAQLTDMNEKLTAVHELMLAAKGARYAIIGAAALAGFLSGKVGGLFSALGFKM
jgi:hypothetical protein